MPRVEIKQDRGRGSEWGAVLIRQDRRFLCLDGLGRGLREAVWRARQTAGGDPRRSSQQGQGPETGICWAGLRNIPEANMAGASVRGDW